MEQLTTQYINILSATEWLLVAVAIVLVISLFSFNKQRKIQAEQMLSMQVLQRDLRALANAAVGVGGRVLEIERQQRKQPARVIVQEQKQPQVAAPIELYQSPNHPYEQAIRMVQTGASVDDIVNVCGLSKSEAELVSMMHRLDKAS